jgi:Excalibur calcium-binding domain
MKTAAIPVPESFSAQPMFQCDGRKYCSQMNAPEEAQFYIANCPNTEMDGDHNGEPYENQF